MITFAIISLVSGNVYVNDTFTTEDSKPGDIRATYADCKAGERMLSPCVLMSERRDGLIVFSNIEAGYQLVVEKGSF